MVMAGEATEYRVVLRGPGSRAETVMSRWGMKVGGGWAGSGAADELGITNDKSTRRESRCLLVRDAEG
jgi:hypothetical protein